MILLRARDKRVGREDGDVLSSRRRAEVSDDVKV